jgi:hypothetical protein
MNKLRRTRTYTVCITLMLLLTGCLSYDTTPAEISKQAAIVLDVSKIEVYGIKGTEQMSLMQPSVEQLTSEWLTQRVQYTGTGTKRMVIDIDDATMVQNPTASKPVFDAFTSRIALTFKLYGDGHLAERTMRMNMTVTREMEKDPSIAVRDTFFASMGKAIVVSLDQKVPAQIRQEFPELLARTQY